ncbi:hypothetical protein SteCoe_18474 [Stentor coeruleus]|uniref:Uncharacterized protein n=1 Tax=Stentor coeruleus TaxID=5963 RepID=A0A1R2BWB5_9CILI|nr:hypothetical protein SteCoe_18474 [Stentor coeruleus]
MVFKSFSEVFHSNFFRGRFPNYTILATSALFWVPIPLVLSWFFGTQYRYKVTVRNFFNEKLLKYLPQDAGGNYIFPFSGATFYNAINFPRTQWSSFDQRSYFPHTDKFKMKIAICHEDLSLIKTLISRGFDINSIIDNKKHLRPISLAAILGKVELIEYLYSRGASLELTDNEGNTPLMLTVIYDQPEAAKKLVLLGAEVNTKDKYGYTAEDKAINRGKDHISNFLQGFKKIENIPIANPVTYKLEDYEYLSSWNPEDIAKKYDVKKYYKPIVYPYFYQSRGLLVYFFTGVDLDDIDQLTGAAAFHNINDDRRSSDQQQYSLGEAFAQGAVR